MKKSVRRASMTEETSLKSRQSFLQDIRQNKSIRKGASLIALMGFSEDLFETPVSTGQRDKINTHFEKVFDVQNTDDVYILSTDDLLNDVRGIDVNGMTVSDYDCDDVPSHYFSEKVVSAEYHQVSTKDFARALTEIHFSQDIAADYDEAKKQISEFQLYMELSCTGRVNQATHQAFVDVFERGLCEELHQINHMHQFGPGVASLQERLLEAGYLSVPVTGFMNRATERALLDFYDDLQINEYVECHVDVYDKPVFDALLDGRIVLQGRYNDDFWKSYNQKVESYQKNFLGQKERRDDGSILFTPNKGVDMKLALDVELLTEVAIDFYKEHQVYLTPEFVVAMAALETGIGQYGAYHGRDPFNTSYNNAGRHKRYASKKDGYSRFYELISKEYLGQHRDIQDLLAHDGQLRAGLDVTPQGHIFEDGKEIKYPKKSHFSLMGSFRSIVGRYCTHPKYESRIRKLSQKVRQVTST